MSQKICPNTGCWWLLYVVLTVVALPTLNSSHLVTLRLHRNLFMTHQSRVVFIGVSVIQGWASCDFWHHTLPNYTILHSSQRREPEAARRYVAHSAEISFRQRFKARAPELSGKVRHVHASHTECIWCATAVIVLTGTKWRGIHARAYGVDLVTLQHQELYCDALTHCRFILELFEMSQGTLWCQWW